MRLIGAMVCLLAAPWVQLSASAGNGWPHNALRRHWLMPISCHFRDCKALLVTSLTHVSSAIASVQTFTFRAHSGLLPQSKVVARSVGYSMLLRDAMHKVAYAVVRWQAGCLDVCHSRLCIVSKRLKYGHSCHSE